MDSSETDKMVGLLSRKLQLFKEILACAREQRMLIYQEHQSQYDNLLETRAKYMEEIDKLQVVLDRGLNQLGRQSDNDNHFREQLAAFNAEITEIIRMTLSIDTENKTRMLQEKAQLQEKVQNLRQGRKGVAGYKVNNRLSSAGYYTDSKR